MRNLQTKKYTFVSSFSKGFHFTNVQWQNKKEFHKACCGYESAQKFFCTNSKKKNENLFLLQSFYSQKGKKILREVSKANTRSPANEKVSHCRSVFVPVLSNNLQTNTDSVKKIKEKKKKTL